MSSFLDSPSFFPKRIEGGCDISLLLIVKVFASLDLPVDIWIIVPPMDAFSNFKGFSICGSGFIN